MSSESTLHDSDAMCSNINALHKPSALVLNKIHKNILWVHEDNRLGSLNKTGGCIPW